MTKSAAQTALSARAYSVLTFLASFALACGSGGGGGSDQGVVSKLSPDQQQAYQTWLKAPVKSCQAIEVIGGGSTDPSVPGFPGGGFPGFPSGSSVPTASARSGQDAIEKGLDLKVLAERTGGSLWLSDSLKPDVFALLSGGASGFTSGSSTSKFEQSITINGSAQSVKVETRSSGFDCVVKINDVQVAQISIARSVDVALAGSGTSNFKDLEIASSGFLRGHGAVTTMSTLNLTRAIDATLRQEATAVGLAMKLGYSEAEAKKYFVLRGSNVNGAFGIEFPVLAGRVAFVGESEAVLDQDEAAQLPVDGQPKILSLVSMYRTGGVSIGGVRFSPGSNEVMTVRRQVSMTLGSPNVVIHDLGVKSLRSITATPEMADTCAGDRVAGYAGLYLAKLRARANAELPSRRLIFGACEALDPEIQVRYNRSELSTRVLNTLMSGVTRDLIRDSGLRFSFGDWTSFVAGEIRLALDVKSSSKLALSGDAPILNEIDGYIASARLTPEYRQMSPIFIDPLAGAVLSLSEASRGASIENSLLRRTIQAAVKIGPVYLVPFARSLQYVRTSPMALEDSLSWIESATATLLQAGREALAEAQALGYERFQSDFEKFFVAHPTEAELTLARDEMRSLKVQLASYPALAGIKRDVVETVYRNPRFDAKDLPVTLDAASKLVVASDEIAREFLLTVKPMSDAREVVAAREWALKLTPGNAKLIRDYLSAALSSGFGDDALAVVRAMIHTRPTVSDLQDYSAAVTLAKQFSADEAKRAAGSASDTFYESDAKTLAKRIVLEGFSSTDIAGLESMAQVAASDAFCGSRKTVSYRLKCVGLEPFSKGQGKMFSPDLKVRNTRIATQMASWMQTLKPETDHSSVRRTLKKLMFDSEAGPWATCDSVQFDVNRQSLATAVQGYIQVMSDFSARFRAERSVSAAADARCP